MSLVEELGLPFYINTVRARTVCKLLYVSRLFSTTRSRSDPPSRASSTPGFAAYPGSEVEK